jgi:hypothetical protein
MCIIVKFLDVWLVLPDKFNGERKRHGRIDVVVAKDLVMDGTDSKHMGLKRNFDRNRLFLLHGMSPSSRNQWVLYPLKAARPRLLVLRARDLVAPVPARGGSTAMTSSARRHAAA